MKKEMIKKVIVASMFFTIGASAICFGKSENSISKVETVEKGITLYEFTETGEQFFVCSKGKTVVFVPEDTEGWKELPEAQPEHPKKPIEDPTEEDPTEEEPIYEVY